MEFLEKEISESLGFKEIWTEITPESTIGKEFKNRVTPFLAGDENKLKNELDNLELMISRLEKQSLLEIKRILSEFKDITTTLERSRNEKAVLDEIELFEIKTVLSQNQIIKKQIKKLEIEAIFQAELYSFNNLRELLNKGQNDSSSFYIADDYDRELSSLREKRKKIEQKLIKSKKVLTDKIEKIIEQPVPFSDEISISKSDKELQEKLDSLDCLRLVKENFATFTYQIRPTKKILDFEEKSNKLRQQERERKKIVREKLTTAVAAKSGLILENLEKIAYLDFLIAKAEFAELISGVKPEITDQNKLMIKEGRHLLVERELARKNLNFTPISVDFKQGSSLITGPNMGGKTVTLKMMGLLTAMAQHGLFVPVKKMEFSLREFVYFTFSSDNIKSNLSTFGSEIINLKKVLSLKESSGLVLIDEIAHGTNPTEGYAIAAAIIEEFNNSNSTAVFTTHFERLAVLMTVEHYQVIGLDEDKISKYKNKINSGGIELLNKCMDYRLEKVEVGHNIAYDAIRIAEILGLEENILNKARSLLN